MLYNASELRKKLNGGGSTKKEIREFEPQTGKLYYIWIPEDACLYLKKHFNLRKIPACRNSKVGAITCINSDPKLEKRKCIVCEYISELWASWRSEKDAKAKTSIVNTINLSDTDHVYVNAIDINDPELKFEAFRLTKGMVETMAMATDSVPIKNIIWQYKKTEKNSKIDHLFLESLNDPKAEAMCAQYEALRSRDWAAGGLNDLEAGLIYKTTEARYTALITGAEYDESLETEKIDHSSKPKQSPSKTKKSKEVTVDDEEIDLDGLDLDDEPKTTSKKEEKLEDDDLELGDELDEMDDLDDEPKTTSKKEEKLEDDDLELGDELDDLEDLDDEPKTTSKKEEKLEGDDLELGDLELDDLELEDLDEEVEKIKVDSNWVKANKSDKAAIEKVVGVLVSEGHMKKQKTFAEDLKFAYAVMSKKKLTVEIEHIEDMIPF